MPEHRIRRRCRVKERKIGHKTLPAHTVHLLPAKCTSIHTVHAPVRPPTQLHLPRISKSHKGERGTKCTTVPPTRPACILKPTTPLIPLRLKACMSRMYIYMRIYDPAYACTHPAVPSVGSQPAETAKPHVTRIQKGTMVQRRRSRRTVCGV